MDHSLIKLVLAFLIFLSLGCSKDTSHNRQTPQLISDNCEQSAEIVGGCQVAPNDVIAQSTVKVSFRTAKKRIIQFCSGSLISERFVLTAAHCADGAKGMEIESVFGERRQIEQVFLHPLYRKNALRNRHDFALLRFSPHENFKNIVQLSDRDSDPLFQDFVFIAGFGRSTEQVPGPQNLKRLTVQVVNTTYSESEIAVIQQTGAGASFGDSGGPGYIVKNHVIQLWGVDSRSPGNSVKQFGQTETIEIYSKVSSSLNWIHEVIDCEDQN